MATDIFRLLEKDHQEVKSMMEKISEGDAGAERKRIFDKLMKELLAHAKAEEKEFYVPLKRDDETAEKASHSVEEHQEAEKLLHELDGMDAAGDDWMEKFDELRSEVEHHIEEEQNELFPKARRVVGDRAEEIGRRFEQSKQEILRNGGPAGSSRAGEAGAGNGDEVAGMTRDELYDRARELGIEGRSKMTKSELVRAVRARL